ncbi:Pyroglutamyl-peptidase I [Planctomycetales bacterium 10988]|nr:Pyroglutamyl-peptidase I [Planctomycetales bacterium 10988]
MDKVLLTAFEPFGAYSENSSLLCLERVSAELESRLPNLRVETRVYPVDFLAAREVLQADLYEDMYRFCLHLGQSSQSPKIQLELIALNKQGDPLISPEEYPSLVRSGPLAYESRLPAKKWINKLRERGIPATVSFFAGLYLCNGLYYWNLHFQAKNQTKTPVLFLHLPLLESQLSPEKQPKRILTLEELKEAVLVILENIDDLKEL